MRVGEIMRGDVELVEEGSTVQEAARIMADLDARAILIGSDGVPQGILTDRDIIIRVVAAGHDPRVSRAGDAMSAALFRCREDDDCAAVAREMRQKQVRQMPVFDRDNRWVGLVALEDIEGEHASS